MPWLRPFLIALTFLTRLPAPAPTPVDEHESGASLVAYPMVGAVIGAILVLLALLTTPLPNLLQACIIVAAWIIITGALHIDGLADSADAWIGGLGSRTQTLAIMKDPACGPAAVTAIVMVVAIKIAAVMAIIEAAALLLLLLAPIVARAGLVVLLMTTPYVRSGGIGESLSLYAPPLQALGSAALITFIIALFNGWAGIVGVIAGSLMLALAQHSMVRRIGGTTGDTAGASVELTETAALAAAATLVASSW
ncbi:adenosylcobinamide-GDP ribazoletransferase [Halorhodospira halochloris]|uniref:adenosylcobinamide-GDP ribazoletransferase n=1 Tax=Halorhodospira halochloris TaxID=1052 RepID=UPI001EE97C9F|nr:adenosylcobinamide-GDP ribazoletransferase [Halorhodospira halochloris]MCG5547555.1 adenosylcobinamide-GDP ribazoletransferase [Halorhodospira halochloris]